MIHTWANVALIFLISLSIIAWAIPLALLVLCVKGMQSARKQLSDLAPRAQASARQMTTFVEHGSIEVARPVVRAHAWWAGVRGTIRHMAGRRASNRSRIP